MPKKKKIENIDNQDKVELPTKTRKLINLTDIKYQVESFFIEPKGSIELTKELKGSKQVKHGVDIGIFKID